MNGEVLDEANGSGRLEQVADQAKEILDGLRASGVMATSLATHSRAVMPGDVFLAYPGERDDGRRHIAQALERGAAAVLWERTAFEWRPAWQVPNIPVEGLREQAGYIAHELYGRPSEHLWTMGVTGTNGKTSCSHWIAQGCAAAGARTAVIGTLGLGFPSPPGEPPARLRPLANTTPDAVQLHRSMADLAREGAQGVVTEVSSIGLDQGRVNGIAFGAALFTNLSRDHLDYHGDMERYARAKQRLFQTPGLRHAVLNLDDVQGVQLARMLAQSGINRIGYSCFEGVALRAGLDGYIEAQNLRVSASGIAFDLRSSWGADRVESPLLGRFNAGNLVGVLGMMLASGVPFEAAMAAVRLFHPITGRMQRLGGSGRPLVVVDYAHSPDALEKTLGALREAAQESGGRLLAVFGCGGDRDRGKRRLMGAVASRYADAILITSDNPRSEDPETIIDEIVEGVTIPHERVTERREAIAKAIASSSANDVILLAGKGHETYQEIAGRQLPFSDPEEAQKALERCWP